MKHKEYREYREYREYKADILRIIDGDTVEAEIDLGFGIKYISKLRFLNYDAPETYRPSCFAEKLAGNSAKQYLTDRLFPIESFPNDFKINPQIIIRTYKDKKGKYGRILCRIFINDVDIIQDMIEMGFTKKEEWK